MPEHPPPEPIHVEEILDEIRRKTREEFHASYGKSDLRADLQRVMDDCRLKRERVISSQRPWLGRLFVWIRKALHAEMRRTVDPSLEKQSEWNRRVARILRHQQDELERMRRVLDNDAGAAWDAGSEGEEGQADASAPRS